MMPAVYDPFDGTTTDLDGERGIFDPFDGTVTRMSDLAAPQESGALTWQRVPVPQAAVAPQASAPLREVPFGEAADRAFGQSVFSGLQYTLGQPMASPFMGASLLTNLVARPLGANPTFGLGLGDWAVETFVDPLRKRAQRLAIDPRRERLTTAGQVGNVVGDLAGMLAAGFFGNKAAGLVKSPEIPIELGASIARRYGAALANVLPKAFTQIQPIVGTATQSRVNRLVAEGVPEPVAVQTAVAEYPAQQLSMLPPVSAPGGTFMRGLQGAASVIPGNISAMQAGNEALQKAGYGQYAVDPWSFKAQGPSAGIGGLLGMLFGPRAGRSFPSPDAMQANRAGIPPDWKPNTAGTFEDALARSTRYSMDLVPPDAAPEVAPSVARTPQQIAAALFPAPDAELAPVAPAYRSGIPLPESVPEFPRDKFGNIVRQPRSTMGYTGANPLGRMGEQRLRDAVRQTNEALFPQPDLANAPFAADTGIRLEGDVPPRVLSDADVARISRTFGIAPEEVIAMSAEAQRAVLDHADKFDAAKSMGLARGPMAVTPEQIMRLPARPEDGTPGGMAARKQAAQDITAMTGEPRDLRDAGAGGTTTAEGTLRTTDTGFTFLDAKVKGGQMVQGERVEVLDSMVDDKGTAWTLIRRENGETMQVPDERLTTLGRPKRPRYAQDVSSRTYAPPKGVGTGPDQPEPRVAAQRITTKESPTLDRGLRIEPQPTIPPRQGATYDQQATRLITGPRGEPPGGAPRETPELPAPKPPELPAPKPPEAEIPALREAVEPTMPAKESRGPRASQLWVEEGLTDADRMARRTASEAQELARQIREEISSGDFAPNDIPTSVRMWAKDANVPAEDLRGALISRLQEDGVSSGRLNRLKRAFNKDAGVNLYRLADKSPSPQAEPQAPKPEPPAQRPVPEPPQKPEPAPQNLKGRKVAWDVEMADGTKRKVSVDAEQYLGELDRRADAIRALIKCLTG